MRIDILTRTAAAVAALGLALSCAGCAATAGSAMGTSVGYAVKGTGVVVGGAGKTMKLAGRTVKGAVHGVHEEFSGNDGGGEAYVEDQADVDEPNLGSDSQGAALAH